MLVFSSLFVESYKQPSPFRGDRVNSNLAVKRRLNGNSNPIQRIGLNEFESRRCRAFYLYFFEVSLIAVEVVCEGVEEVEVNEFESASRNCPAGPSTALGMTWGCVWDDISFFLRDEMSL